jgi:electron transfer flavoprotein alpha/beta subunit
LYQWKPVDIGLEATPVGAAASALERLSNLAPQQVRKGVIYEGTADEMVAKLLDDLIREGMLP